MATSSLDDDSGGERMGSVFAQGVKVAKAGLYDYAIEMFALCVCKFPGNAVYLDHLLHNLWMRFPNKRASLFARSWSRPLRLKVRKRLATSEWMKVFCPAIDILKNNPWDIEALMALAQACEQLGFRETELAYLRVMSEAQRRP